MPIGVAVIGAGMAGRAHAAAYRVAPTLYDSTLPTLRYVSIADVSPELGDGGPALRLRTQRHVVAGHRRDPTSMVSVVVANRLHREMVEGLLAAGKHVLCEKPLSDSLEDARSMVAAAGAAERGPDRLHLPPGPRRGRPARWSLRRPGRRCTSMRATGATTPPTAGPDELALQGRAGFGRAGRHRQPHGVPGGVPGRRHHEVSGGRFPTAITERPVALGAVVGHGGGGLRDATRPSRTTTTPRSAPPSRRGRRRPGFTGRRRAP